MPPGDQRQEETAGRWPRLPFQEWKDTCETLHLWTQIVGKVKLALTPFVNQWWNVGFDVTARGLSTGIIPAGDRVLQCDFDFLSHDLTVSTSEGQHRKIILAPRSVADFHSEFVSALRSLKVDATISTRPVEMGRIAPFELDRLHASYDRVYVERWWRILVETTRILMRHRASFSGKSSPILFYWGSFDLNHTRFSGRAAPLPQGPRFYQLAEDQENVACGFWPGNPNAQGATYGAPAFYSYTYPAPPGFRDASVRPHGAYYDDRFGEFVLRYDEAIAASSPADAILDFFRSTYEAGSSLGRWQGIAGARTGAWFDRGDGRQST